MKKTGLLLLSIIVVSLLGASGSFFTSSSINSWYTTINKPSFNPPNWIFGPVWTILFILMGISIYLILSKGWNSKGVKVATILFAVHMAVNILWSLLFFGLQNPLLAFIDIIVLWVMILTLMVIFYKISKPAAYLLIPYFLWVSFASILNLSIYIIN